MKKLIILAIIIVIFPCVAYPCDPEPVIYVGTIGGGGTIWPILIMQGAVLLSISPWLWMWYDNPDCRDKLTIDEMAKCVMEKK